MVTSIDSEKNTKRKSKKKSYKFKKELSVEVTKSGFFGLNQINPFFAKVVDSFCINNDDTVVVLDFSKVKAWDISALLWMVVALDYYKKEYESPPHNLKFLLKLPEPNITMSVKEKDEYEKSADYLRKWRFDVALKNLSLDVDDLLIKKQKNYFKYGPKRFYKVAGDIENPILRDLFRRGLVEITNLSDVYQVDGRKIEENLAGDYRASFGNSGIETVLREKCGIPEKRAKVFSKHIINEGILNVQQHPEASIGMVSVSVLGKANRLVLAMVDNGDPICKTIYRHYIDEKNKNLLIKDDPLPDFYDNKRLTINDIADIITHATQEGTSRKKIEILEKIGSESKTQKKAIKIGMGLYYIRNDTTDPRDYKGELIICTAGVSVRYTKPTNMTLVGHDKSPLNYGFVWPGNLLRVSFPLKKRK